MSLCTQPRGSRTPAMGQNQMSHARRRPGGPPLFNRGRRRHAGSPDAKATRRRVRKREVRTLRNIPAPSCNTRTLGPLAKSERPYNPHVLRVGLNGHPPGGGWFVLSRLGEEWGCAKESRRAELARKRRHRGSAFTITNRRNKRLNLSRS